MDVSDHLCTEQTKQRQLPLTPDLVPHPRGAGRLSFDHLHPLLEVQGPGSYTPRSTAKKWDGSDARRSSGLQCGESKRDCNPSSATTELANLWTSYWLSPGLMFLIGTRVLSFVSKELLRKFHRTLITPQKRNWEKRQTWIRKTNQPP